METVPPGSEIHILVADEVWCALAMLHKNHPQRVSFSAGHYAHIRQDKTIQPPDAIQLACAASTCIDLFITNDDRLSRKNIPGINFITSLARAPI